jgi:hypothetical protein
LSEFDDEIRRQLDKVYPALEGLLQTVHSMPEGAPNRSAYEALIEDLLANVRIAGAMLAREQLDEYDRRVLNEVPPETGEPEANR